jgi:surface antigen
MRFKHSMPALLACTLLLPASPSAWADPPPWAPAHGWRKKQDSYYTGYSGKHWGEDYGIIEGRCNRDRIGTVLGGLVGGAVGSSIGKGDGKAVAIILGSVLGAVIGRQIGAELDRADRACIGHALELAADRRTVVWSNPDSGLDYRLTPIRGFDVDGRKCREFELDVTGEVSGRRYGESRREQACQVSEGTWEPR